MNKPTKLTNILIVHVIYKKKKNRFKKKEAACIGNFDKQRASWHEIFEQSNNDQNNNNNYIMFNNIIMLLH